MASEKYIPKNPNDYQGKQVIIDSDRLVFNAKNESIFLFSHKAIGFSTNGSINFDTGDEKEGNNPNKVIINSPNIYLGLEKNIITGKSDLPTEPAVLGNELGKLLYDLMETLDDLTDKLTYEMSYVTPTGPSSVSVDPSVLLDIKSDINSYKDRLGKDFSSYSQLKGSILSDKVKLT